MNTPPPSVHLSCVLEKVADFLNENINLANSHISDFFVDSLFQKNLSSNILNEINSNPQGALDNLLLQLNNSEFVFLNEFVETCKSFVLYNIRSVCLDKNDFLKSFDPNIFKSDDYNYYNCKFNGFMSSKKSHEVQILNLIAKILFKENVVNCFVHVGDGKGYLSSLLALESEMPILGIDSSKIKTKAAFERTKKLEKNWNGFFNKESSSTNSKPKSSNFYKQITHFVNEKTDISKLISENFPEEKKKCDLKLGLTGLHTCGDLGAVSTNIFLKNPEIKTLLNVSCCYHLLSENNDENKFYFPLSDFLSKKKKNFKLGRNARMLAAQSIDRIKLLLLNDRQRSNKINFYRAILQVILKKYNNNNNNLQSYNIGRINKRNKNNHNHPFDNFEDYVRTAFGKINATNLLNFVSNEELSLVYERFEKEEKRFFIYNLLRCHLAPVVETLILLDRLMLLQENGISRSYLVRLFDPVKSPRCYGLIAFKDY